MENDEAVKINNVDQAAGQKEGVETTANDAPNSEVDYVKLLAEKDAEIAKEREEKENYKKGLLQAKGKIPKDDSGDDDDLDLDTRIKLQIREALADSKEAQAAKEKDDLIKQMARENQELKLALKNKNTVSQTSAGSGGNQDQEKGQQEFFTPEQKKVLISKGLDPEKVKETYLKKK